MLNKWPIEIAIVVVVCFVVVVVVVVHNAIFYIHRNISIHRYIGCIHVIEIHFFQRHCYLIGRKNRLDIKVLILSLFRSHK